MSSTITAETSTILGRLFHGTLVPNKAMQILLNQGQKALSKHSEASQAKIRKILTILQTYNPKISSLKAYPKEDVFLDTPLVANLGDQEIVLDWTTAYLLIDAKLGGINGLSIEKRRYKTYSHLEKKLLSPFFNSVASLFTNFPIITLEEEVKFPERLCFFMLQTPQAMGFIGLPSSFFNLEKAPLFSLDFLKRHLSFQLESFCYQQKFPLAEALRIKKGALIPLKSPLEITLSCGGDTPIARAFLDLSNKEDL